MPARTTMNYYIVVTEISLNCLSQIQKSYIKIVTRKVNDTNVDGKKGPLNFLEIVFNFDHTKCHRKLKLSIDY